MINHFQQQQQRQQPKAIEWKMGIKNEEQKRKKNLKFKIFSLSLKILSS